MAYDGPVLGVDEAERLDRLLRAGAPLPTLEEARALASVEARLFGRTPRPLTLARYVLLDRLGTGGAGAVYRAFDPELDRRVAIKLLLAGEGDAQHERRLLREARALARLSHRNVVAVYDVGRYDERDLGYELGTAPADLEIPARGVFLVMELIGGLDLRQWLDAQNRSNAEIVDAFVQAARGLAAVHDAGLVHRDFKTRNARMGADGRVVVLDLGLARPVSVIAQSEVVGTLPYISPEQRAGAPADARSDQFAFGVALHEALTGSWPHVPPDSAGRKRAGASIPRCMQVAVERMLDERPERRFADMQAVASALYAARPRRRSRWLLGSTLVGAMVGAAWLVRGDDPVCSGSERALAGAWDDGRREALRERFAASERPYAAASWMAVQTELDAYAARWVEMHRSACEATRVRSEQPETLLDLRMACLDRRLHEMRALVETLTDAGDDAVSHAVTAVSTLGWLGACANADRLRAGVDLPQDPGLRAAVLAAYDDLVRAEAFERAGLYDAAMDRLETLAADPVTSAHAPLRAAVALREGSVLERLGELTAARARLVDAAAAAEAGRDDEVAADAWLRLLWVVGVEQHDLREGELYARFAQAAVERLGDDPLRRARLDHNLGGLSLQGGDTGAALTHYLRALEAQVRLLGEHDPAVAMTHNHIGNVLMVAERFDEAREHVARSLTIRTRVLGESHPDVAYCFNNIAEIHRLSGACEQAIEVANQALAISGGTGRADELVALDIRMDCLTRLDRIEEAERDRVRGLAIRGS
jgi:eukaryotic-like serine/threonine-protein kinase